MSKQPTDNLTDEERDSKADTRAILIIFTAAILMAVHFISGYSF